MLALIQKHNVKIIAIGNGTASRESEMFVANLIKKYNLDVKYVIVSEAGASVYSASPLAKKNFLIILLNKEVLFQLVEDYKMRCQNLLRLTQRVLE